MDGPVPRVSYLGLQVFKEKGCCMHSTSFSGQTPNLSILGSPWTLEVPMAGSGADGFSDEDVHPIPDKRQFQGWLVKKSTEQGPGVWQSNCSFSPVSDR